MPRRDPEKLARARALRANMSKPERVLWSLLRAHRLAGFKFTRQIECGPFHIDFAARMHRLAIELDGETHGGRELQDAGRTRYLERCGWSVIRFTNSELMTNAGGVSRAILIELGSDPDSPSPRQVRGDYHPVIIRSCRGHDRP